MGTENRVAMLFDKVGSAVWRWLHEREACLAAPLGRLPAVAVRAGSARAPGWRAAAPAGRPCSRGAIFLCLPAHPPAGVLARGAALPAPRQRALHVCQHACAGRAQRAQRVGAPRGARRAQRRAGGGRAMVAHATWAASHCAPVLAWGAAASCTAGRRLASPPLALSLPPQCPTLPLHPCLMRLLLSSAPGTQFIHVSRMSPLQAVDQLERMSDEEVLADVLATLRQVRHALSRAALLCAPRPLPLPSRPHAPQVWRPRQMGGRGLSDGKGEPTARRSLRPRPPPPPLPPPLPPLPSLSDLPRGLPRAARL